MPQAPQSHFKRCACGGVLKCKDSRSSWAGGLQHIRRRYHCVDCGQRISSAEFFVPNAEGRRGMAEQFIKQEASKALGELKAKILEMLP